VSPDPANNRMRKRRVRVQPEQTCPLCREGIRPEHEELSVCTECGTVYHRGCVAELGGGRCSTQGCAPARTEPQPEPQPEAQAIDPPSETWTIDETFEHLPQGFDPWGVKVAGLTLAISLLASAMVYILGVIVLVLGAVGVRLGDTQRMWKGLVAVLAFTLVCGLSRSKAQVPVSVLFAILTMLWAVGVLGF
jgi:hypothetical protein